MHAPKPLCTFQIASTRRSNWDWRGNLLKLDFGIYLAGHWSIAHYFFPYRDPTDAPRPNCTATATRHASVVTTTHVTELH